MQTCLITFTSQTAASRMKRVANAHGIRLAVVQAPKEISFGGCSVAVRCERERVFDFISLCRKYNISYSRVFAEMLDRNGRRQYEEINV